MRMIRLPELQQKVGLKKSAIYDQIKNGDLPAPTKLGAASAWPEEEIDRWLAERRLKSVSPAK